ncbi:MAG: hypothetical protein GX846_00595 [Deltaproteobacteria bacterium]|jgi:hypothetical protein|nr:hypothetical protein [Deltaproteobacteria bacterium]
MYKKLLKSLGMVGLVALTLGSLPAFAEDDSLSISADVGIYSQYIWRGYTLSDESIVIQPSVTLGYRGFSLNVWGNFDTDYFDTGTDYNRTDITLSYNWSNDVIDVGLGYIYSDLDHAEDDQEFYFTATLAGYLNPKFSFYKDINGDNEGWYINLGFSHSYAITNLYNLDLSASIGYYDLDDGSYNALHDGNITASMIFPVNDNLSFTPSLSYIVGVSTKSKARIKDYKGNSDHFVGGFKCTYSF